VQHLALGASASESSPSFCSMRQKSG
jgi:hypothetical protein